MPSLLYRYTIYTICIYAMYCLYWPRTSKYPVFGEGAKFNAFLSNRTFDVQTVFIIMVSPPVQCIHFSLIFL